MAENEAPQGAEPVEGEQAQGTDWKAEARKWESRAKQNLADAKANEGAAQRLAEIEEAQKTEAQKAQERLEAAEKRAAELELRAARAEVAATKGVPANLLSGSTQEELEASADALLAFRGEQQQKLIIPNEGKSPQGPIGAEKDLEFANFLTRRTN
ncbi:hypothetical protein AB0300_18220 [Microbacterium sp. NPDC078814]|uniref:hypothetical protein n=1 Tax=Microbacterium sp. NPDC078814 TaxID=3154767 RepID=UPI00344DD15B